MADVVMEEIRPLTQEAEEKEYYRVDESLYDSPKFRAIMDEILAEEEYMEAHPEEYKRYTSTKEMFRDMGFDVSNMSDD